MHVVLLLPVQVGMMYHRGGGYPHFRHPPRMGSRYRGDPPIPLPSLQSKNCTPSPPIIINPSGARSATASSHALHVFKTTHSVVQTRHNLKRSKNSQCSVGLEKIKKIQQSIIRRPLPTNNLFQYQSCHLVSLVAVCRAALTPRCPSAITSGPCAELPA